ncbi:MAG: membrane protein insertase YidC [Pseudomonadota bacterium]
MQQQQQDPDQTKNILMAVILSVGVLFAWQVFYAGPKMKAERERQARIEAQQRADNPNAGLNAGPTAPGLSGPTSGSGAQTGPAATTTAPAALQRLATVDRATALKATQRIAIDTPSIQGSINLTGAKIDDVTLKKHHLTPDPTSPNVVLFSPTNAPNPYFADLTWRAPAGVTVKLPDATTVWSAPDGATLRPGAPVTLTWDNGAGLTFKRQITVDPDYMFTVSDTVENTTDSPITLFPAGAIYRYGIPGNLENFFIQHEGLIGVLGEDGFTELTYGEALEEGGGVTKQNASGGWLGFTDKYWAASLIPDQARPFNASLSNLSPLGTPRNRTQFASSFASQALVIDANSSAITSTRLFVGAKKVGLIEKYEESLGIRQFELMIDWGWFYFITKPLFYVLDYLYQLLGNFGFAILGVTVIVKAMFFWFANKSYESMAKMKKMQPEMEKIRERYKDDKTEQQKALMQLYQKEKINPLAGCLPVLIQIPVFFALYKVLFISIDMRHAPFVGWIQDLSAPDPTSITNLFGLMPWEPVENFLFGYSIGIWPIFMGITMWMQMQLNPQQPDPVQQAVFNWMPVMFTFLLAGFASGLVIYWAWNNVLSIAQQYFIMKRQGVEVHLMDNLKKTGSAARGLAGNAKGLMGGQRKTDNTSDK